MINSNQQKLELMGRYKFDTLSFGYVKFKVLDLSFMPLILLSTKVLKALPIHIAHISPLSCPMQERKTIHASH